jgi:hypothetical protein
MNDRKRNVAILFTEMRRLVLFIASVAALAAPAAVLAAKDASGDGSLVIKNGAAGKGPVVMLVITGSVIGEVTGQGRIVIDAGVNGETPEVTGAGAPKPVPTDKDGSARQWGTSPDGFKFRAVDGRFTILIYGSRVNLTAVGKGKVKVAGDPDAPKSDGRYSLNGDDFRSLPGQQTDWLLFPANG